MKNPRQEIFNKMAESWDRTIILTENQKVTISDVIASIRISGPDKVLDVGSGTGVLVPYVLKYLNKTGEMTCIDVSDKMIETAETKYNDKRLKFIHSDIYDFDHNADYYDKIIVFSAFPHLHDKPKSLDRFYCLLKEAGKLLIFHVQSSAAINDLHRKKVQDEVLQKDYLPNIDEAKKLIDLSLWKIIITEDREGLYRIILEKK